MFLEELNCPVEMLVDVIKEYLESLEEEQAIKIQKFLEKIKV